MADSWVEIQGRRIKLCDDAVTQSVNICTPSNLEGAYDHVFYFGGTHRVQPKDIEPLTDLAAVVTFLRGRSHRQVYGFFAQPAS